jgi:hypothetical protein
MCYGAGGHPLELRELIARELLSEADEPRPDRGGEEPSGSSPEPPSFANDDRSVAVDLLDEHGA